MICAGIATSTHGLTRICSEVEGAPSAKQVWEWLTKYPDFRDKYEKSRAQQQELMAEEIVAIADETSRDSIVTDAGGETPNHEWMARSRLRVDTRKWLMSKLAPKKYGDKLDVEHSGSVTTTLTLDDWRQRMKEIQEATGDK